MWVSLSPYASTRPGPRWNAFSTFCDDQRRQKVVETSEGGEYETETEGGVGGGRGEGRCFR